MNFRTEINSSFIADIIRHDTPIVMLGSCFSDEIGLRLHQDLFDVDINPFGTLYNPASIARAIDKILSGYRFSPNDLIKIDGDNRYHSFSHHSAFSCANADDMLTDINTRISEASTSILSPSATLIITLGTAYVFSLKESGEIVANCHKLPQKLFNRTKLSINDIVETLVPVIRHLNSVNPTLNIVMTVSPIRHLADGAHGNQLSKSTLLLAIDFLCQQFDNITYFPSYEIMLDDLRDYRFYANDMVHPSPLAVDYIYQQVLQSFCTPETSRLAQRCHKLYSRLAHRHMTDDTQVINKFNEATATICSQLVNEYPFLQKQISKITLSL